MTPHTAPFSMTRSVTLLSNRTSPPDEIIFSRKFRTTRIKISVPICGFASYKISSGAPASTKILSASRFLPFLSFTSVLSLPSEKAPAPPSPNWTLESGSKTPLFQNASTSFCRFSTAFPRSSKIGRNPCAESRQPQNKPAGPVPMITGRFMPAGGRHAGN